MRQGVGIWAPEERRQAIGVKRAASVERVENDNAELKRAHVESVREHILELRAAQLAAAPGSSSRSETTPAPDAPCPQAASDWPEGSSSSSSCCRAAEQPEPGAERKAPSAGWPPPEEAGVSGGPQKAEDAT